MLNSCRVDDDLDHLGKENNICGLVRNGGTCTDGISISSSAFSHIEQGLQGKKLYGRIGDGQTRILDLKPGCPGDTLSADLHTANLADDSGLTLEGEETTIQYEAISYHWGAPEYSRTIECNGISYPITKNLYDALRRLRQERRRFIWADCLCINQHDLSERSMQIKNMLAIFRMASSVIVWLGEHSEDSRAALRYYEASDHVRIRSGEPEEGDAYTTPSQNDSLMKRMKVRLMITKLSEPHRGTFLRGIRDLLQRPWYERVWVKQEIWAATHISVRCGESQISWNDLRAFALDMPEEAASFNTFRLGTPEMYQLVNAQDIPTTAQSASRASPENQVELLHVLQRTVGSKCSDLRDRIYGIVGMTRTNLTPDSNVAGPILKIDYQRSVSQVFQDVARYCMERDNHLGVLCLPAEFGGSVDDNDELPSWCPDWNRPFKMNLGAPECALAPSGFLFMRNSTEECVVEQAESWQVLRISACEIGRVISTPYGVTRVILKILPSDPYGTEVIVSTNGGAANVGDIVTLPQGSPLPLILRPQKNSLYFKFVGSVRMEEDVGDWVDANWEMKQYLARLKTFDLT